MQLQQGMIEWNHSRRDRIFLMRISRSRVKPRQCRVVLFGIGQRGLGIKNLAVVLQPLAFGLQNSQAGNCSRFLQRSGSFQQATGFGTASLGGCNLQVSALQFGKRLADVPGGQPTQITIPGFTVLLVGRPSGLSGSSFAWAPQVDGDAGLQLPQSLITQQTIVDDRCLQCRGTGDPAAAQCRLTLRLMLERSRYQGLGHVLQCGFKNSRESDLATVYQG